MSRVGSYELPGEAGNFYDNGTGFTDYGTEFPPLISTWKYGGIHNPGGGTLSIQVADPGFPTPTTPDPVELPGGYTGGPSGAQVMYIPGGMVESDPLKRTSHWVKAADPSCFYTQIQSPITHPLITEVGDRWAVLGDGNPATFIHSYAPTGSSSVPNYFSFHLPRMDIDQALFQTMNVWSIARRCPEYPANYSSAVNIRLSYPGCSGRSAVASEISNGMSGTYITSPGPLTNLPGMWVGYCADHGKWFGSDQPGLYSYNESQYPGWWAGAWAAYTSVQVGEESPLKIEVHPKAGAGDIDIGFLAVVFGHQLVDPWPSGSTEVTTAFPVGSPSPILIDSGDSGDNSGSGGLLPGEWHTADNREPPPDGKPWGDHGVEDGWAHVSWMRRKDQPGSGRTGRLKLRTADTYNEVGNTATDWVPPDTTTGAKWAGHQPGRIYLGMSTPVTIYQQRLAQIGQPIGVRRMFNGSIRDTDLSRELRRADENAAAGVLTWTSVGDLTSRSGWQSIINGQWDGVIAARARAYKAKSYPIIFTYAHEASYDGTDADGPYWAQAFSHIVEVMADAVGGSLFDAGITVAPIQGSWLWNPNNAADTPSAWVTPGLLQTLRAHKGFFGIDVYHQASQEGYAGRVGRVLSYLDGLGYSDLMIGIGETGATSAKWPTWGKTASQWLDEQWAWSVARTNRIGVISYFNDSRNSKDHVYWPLDEPSPSGSGEPTNAKMQSFRAMLSHPAATTLNRPPAGGSSNPSTEGGGGTPSTVPDTPDGGEPTGGFAAITYNMPGWVPNRQSELNDLLGRCSIIGLQEVNWFDDNNWGSKLPGWSFVQRDGKGQNVGWDTSKWVLQEWGWWKIADATSVQPEAAGPTNRPSSGVTWAVLRRTTTGGLLRFGCVHLVPSKHLGGAALALYQTEVAGIAAWWDSTSAYPTLLVGDFNGQPNDGPLGPLRQRAQVQSATSFGSRSIDLLWSSGLSRTGVRSIGGHNSDHKPVRGTYTS